MKPDAALFLILAAFLRLVTLLTEANVNMPPGKWGHMGRIESRGITVMPAQRRPRRQRNMGDATGLKILA